MTCNDDYIRILDVDCFVRYLQFEHPPPPIKSIQNTPHQYKYYVSFT